jgi:pyruvate formate lyase activating enzyme
VGETLEASEVVAQVAKDLAFYRNSGGGVTFSGGEPLSQPDFLADMLEQCRSQHIHTAVETCGAARPEAMAAVADLVDLFLYDVKIVDPSRHRALTGAENTLILENLRSLAARSAEKIVIRVPLVPGCTDSSENLQAIARLAVEIGVGRVWLLPYHNLGAGKYGELGIVCPCDAAPLSADALERAAGLFGEQGLKHEV